MTETQAKTFIITLTVKRVVSHEVYILQF